MDVLLLRPAPRNERFGLGPFFRTEPLGLEYVAAALEARGHRATVIDLRFGWTVERALARVRPAIVGVACMHSLEIDDTLEVARHVRLAAPGAFVLVGGHSASAFPGPLRQMEVDAISVADGERVVADLADVLSRGGSPREVPGLLVNNGRGEFFATPTAEPVDLDEIPLPARHALVTGHRHYACVQFRPTWLVETARGCPFRCSFCSVWPLY
jgi:radical SAM superfamily enzyme YgiQ (UPF0313 family)